MSLEFTFSSLPKYSKTKVHSFLSVALLNESFIHSHLFIHFFLNDFLTHENQV